MMVINYVTEKINFLPNTNVNFSISMACNYCYYYNWCGNACTCQKVLIIFLRYVLLHVKHKKTRKLCKRCAKICKTIEED